MAITPFYRERGNGYPGPEGIPMTGQNFFEHQLYNLRTKIEADSQYAEYANRFSTILGYRNQPQGDKIFIEMVIRRVEEINPETNYQNVETLTPPWLQDLVDKWINVYPEYAVVLSDQYQIKNVPTWWLAEIMPRLDITDIIQKTWFSEDDRSAENYDFFYQNGAIYVRLVNENQDNSGPYSTKSDDLLKTGERAIKRGEFSYKDHADFQTRYVKLHTKLFHYMVHLYNAGVMCLEPQSSFIKDWKLGERLDGINLYEPTWTDVRLTHYDGTTNLLKRQLINYKNQWDYQYVYYQVGKNRVLKHMVASFIFNKKKKIAIFYDEILAISIASYNEAIEIANEIDDIKDNTTGVSVIPIVYKKDSKSSYLPQVIYIDMAIMKIIKSIDTELKIEVKHSIIKKEDLNKIIKEAMKSNIIPSVTELNKMNILAPEISITA